MRKSPGIVPRNVTFGRGQPQARWWLNGDPVATAFYNSMSAIFPKGEAFFIDSVRAFRDGAPPQLRSEEHTSELQSLMRNSYAVFCLKNKKKTMQKQKNTQQNDI